MEGATIPFNLQKLLSKRPSPYIRPWTSEEASTVDTLHHCRIYVEYGDWGTDEDWVLLEPLFDGKGNYLG